MPPKPKSDDVTDAAKAKTAVLASGSTTDAVQTTATDAEKPIATGGPVVTPATAGPIVGAGVQSVAGDGTLPATPVGAGVAEVDPTDVVRAEAALDAATSSMVTGPYVTVVGPARGRRRIGRSFGREPVRIPADELTDDEVKALLDDETLAVNLFRR